MCILAHLGLKIKYLRYFLRFCSKISLDVAGRVVIVLPPLLMQPLADIVTDYDRKLFDNEYIRLYQAKNTEGVLRRKCTFNSACNFPFQSLAALGAKRALWAVWRSKYGKYMVNFIHDEILFELPMETAAEDVLVIEKIMEDAMKKVIPDVRIKAEGCLMDRWDKEAEPVYDLFGNLTVWQPQAA